jgi:hypothetical protein
MRAGYTVSIEWDGEGWTFDDVPVRIFDSAELNGATADYRPRRVSFAVHLGNTSAKLAAGRHYATCLVEVSDGDRVIASGFPSEFRAARAGEATEITIGDVPSFDGSTVPATIDNLIVRRIDVDRTLDVRSRRETQWEAEREAAWRIYNSPWSIFLGSQAWADVFAAINAPSESTFTAYAERAEGRIYPVVFGKPGRDGTLAVRGLAVSFDPPWVMVAGHHLGGGTLTLSGPAHSHVERRARESFEVIDGYDNAGQPIAYCDISGAVDLEHRWATTHPEAAEQEWYAAFDGSASGLPNDAGSVLGWLLARVRGLTVDWGSVDSTAERLRAFGFDGVIDEVASAWDILQTHVLPCLPVALVPSSRGASLRYIETDPAEMRPRFTLVDGAGISVVNAPEYRSSADPDSIRTAIALKWAPNKKTGEYRAGRTLTAARYDWGIQTLDRHGFRLDSLELTWIYDAATAEIVGRNRLRLLAVDRLEVSMIVDGAKYGVGAPAELSIGDCVAVTSAADGLTERVGVVTGIDRDGGRSDLIRVTIFE